MLPAAVTVRQMIIAAARQIYGRLMVTAAMNAVLITVVLRDIIVPAVRRVRVINVIVMVQVRVIIVSMVIH